MKTFLIQSPCHKSNGHHGSYYSIAFTDDEGNVIKGFGDHISYLEYGIKNVFEAEGTSFSDEDRIISIVRVKVDEKKYEEFIESRREFNRLSEELHKRRLEHFGNTYEYVYGKKTGQDERLKELMEWDRENKIPYVDYYDFLKSVKAGE